MKLPTSGNPMLKEVHPRGKNFLREQDDQPASWFGKGENCSFTMDKVD